MKKITNILIVCAVLLGTLFVTGCGLSYRLRETFNQWYVYSNEEGLSIPVSDLSDADSMDSSAGKLMENAQLYVYYDEDDGLTVAVQSTKAQKIQLAGGLLETSVDVVTGATKKYTTKEFGMVKWGLLVASGLFETTSTPEVVAHPDRCIILAGEGEGAEFSFQWKKLLKNILLEQLLGE